MVSIPFGRTGYSRPFPDWMFWMPLVVQHAQVAYEDRWDWERENIPQHSDVRREREEEEY